MKVNKNFVLVKPDSTAVESGFSIYDDYDPQDFLPITGEVLGICESLLFHKMIKSEDVNVIRVNRFYSDRSSEYNEKVLIRKGDRVMYNYSVGINTPFQDCLGDGVVMDYNNLVAFERDGVWTPVNNLIFVEPEMDDVYGSVSRGCFGTVRLVSQVPKDCLYSDHIGDRTLKDGDRVLYNPKNTVKMESWSQNYVGGLLKINRKDLLAKIR